MAYQKSRQSQSVSKCNHLTFLLIRKEAQFCFTKSLWRATSIASEAKYPCWDLQHPMNKPQIQLRFMQQILEEIIFTPLCISVYNFIIPIPYILSCLFFFLKLNSHRSFFLRIKISLWCEAAGKYFSTNAPSVYINVKQELLLLAVLVELAEWISIFHWFHKSIKVSSTLCHALKKY